MSKRVALLIETSSVYGRRILEGIGRSMRIHHDWSVYLEERDLSNELPSWLESWQGDGIISRSWSPQLQDWADASLTPIVELTDRREDDLNPHLRSNDAAIGELAAQHLLERGFRSFGFAGFTKESWSRRRMEAFREAVSDFPISYYESDWLGPSVRPWPELLQELAAWIEILPKPAGILACNDIRGRQVLDACSQMDITVPDDVAVVGVDNDELLCNICNPPLSSVFPNAERLGFRAAELLKSIMAGEDPPQQNLNIEPLGVVTRASSDVMAVTDKELSHALQYIREHACLGITVDAVAKVTGVSRSTLERKVRRYLSRTPQEQIRHVQIQRAQELLQTSELSVEEIAHLCGFEHVEYLHVVFKRLTRITPGQYRKQCKQQSP